MRKALLSMIIVASFVLLALHTPVVAKYIDTGEIKVRNISEIYNAMTFEKVEELYRSSYFEENGFRWYNTGILSKERFINATSELDWVHGFTGWQEGMSWSETADPTTYDGRSIALKAGKLEDDGSFGTVGGFIGKNTLSMHKTYPAYCALPDETYWFNQTVKIAESTYEKTTEGIIPKDYFTIRLPVFTSMIFTAPIDKIEEYGGKTSINVPTRAIGIALQRIPVENPNVNNAADWKNKLLMLTVFEFESVMVEKYTINTTSWTIDWLASENSWIYVISHFVKAADGEWRLRITLKDSGVMIEESDVILNTATYEAELKIFTTQKDMNLFHCWFSSYVYVHKEQLGLATWAAEHGYWGTVVLLIVGCALIALGAITSPAGVGIPLILAGIGLIVIAITIEYLAANVAVWINAITEALRSGLKVIEEFIAFLFGDKPNPPVSIISYIDKISVEYGNIPPDAYLVGGFMKDNVNVTKPHLIGRTHPLLPYDWLECNGTNSIDSDGTINATRFYFGLVEEGMNTTRNLVTTSTQGLMELNESGTGIFKINPKSYAGYRTGADPTNASNTYEQWDPLKVDVKNVVFDDDNGFGLGYGNPLVFPMLFDGLRKWANGTWEVIWQKLLARISPRNIRAGNLVPIEFTAKYSSYRENYLGDYYRITEAIEELWGITYTWSFGDGTTGTGKTVSHKFNPGIYTVTLTVQDIAGNRDIDIAQVFIYEEVQKPTLEWYEEWPYFWYLVGGLVGAGAIGAVAMYAREQPRAPARMPKVHRRPGGKKP